MATTYLSVATRLVLEKLSESDEPLTKRALANETPLCVRTILRSLARLESEGYVQAQRGLDQEHGGHRPTLYSLRG